MKWTEHLLFTYRYISNQYLWKSKCRSQGNA